MQHTAAGEMVRVSYRYFALRFEITIVVSYSLASSRQFILSIFAHEAPEGLIIENYLFFSFDENKVRKRFLEEEQITKNK